MNLTSIIAKVLKKSRLSAIKKSSIHSTSKIESGSSVYFSCFDRHSFCGYNCEIYHADIGSFTSIANNVIIGGARHPMEWVGMSPVFYKGRDSIKLKLSEHPLVESKLTKIGHDVWIGNSAIVLPGVAIGNGAVVGAGAVVTKDVPPYGVAVGNPAKIVRYRFDDDIIASLEEIQWWSMSDEALFELAKFVRDPRSFISACGDL